MRWCLSTLGSAEYIIPVTLSTSVTLVSQYNRRCSLTMHLIEHVWEALGHGDRVNSEMHLEAVIERVWICTWRLRSSEFGDALGGHNRANLHCVIDRVWRYTSRPRLSELRRCTWRPWSSEFGDVLWGCDSEGLEMHLQAMIERDWRSTWRRLIRREARRQLRLYSLVKL